MDANSTAVLVAAILNASYMVRHYRRPASRRQREQAIQVLGMAVRDAFNRSSDFEPLLAAILDGLDDRHERPRF